jgi:putative nucleotidyltransferase with HDIG domain
MFSTDVEYEIIGYSVGDTKAGTKMGKLQLKNLQDGTSLNCILWEETLNRYDSKAFRTGNVIKLITASFNEKFNNCLITTFSVEKEAKTGLEESKREMYYQALMDYISKINDEKLNSFLMRFFMEHKELIKVAPAAKVMHHNYIGGLMVHTLECLQYAEANMEMSEYKFNRDNIFAACILHDIGKIFEYKIDLESGLIDYEEDFRKEWLTHSQYGFSICMTQGFKEVAKMIAAHHGRSDWGAIIDLDQKDLEPELYFIHLIDNLSAKFGKINVSLLDNN